MHNSCLLQPTSHICFKLNKILLHNMSSKLKQQATSCLAHLDFRDPRKWPAAASIISSFNLNGSRRHCTMASISSPKKKTLQQCTLEYTPDAPHTSKTMWKPIVATPKAVPTSRSRHSQIPYRVSPQLCRRSSHPPTQSLRNSLS